MHSGNQEEIVRLNGLRIVFFSLLAGNLYRFRLPVMRRLVSEGAQVYAVAPSGPDADRFKEHGIEFIHFDLDRRTFNPLAGLATIRRLADLLRTLEPHVLHTFTLRPNVYGAIAGRRIGVPLIICTITGLGTLYVQGIGPQWFLARQWVNTLTYCFVRSSAAAIIFQNPDDREYYLHRRLCRPQQAKLILSSGIDTEQFSPEQVSGEVRGTLRKAWDIGTNEIVVTMIARFVRLKGVQEFVEVARRLQGRARFVLIGGPDPGNPVSTSTEKVRQVIETGVIIAPGRQENIAEWLAASDIYVLPSYREGIPRTVLEAMAMGLPIITTDAPGCRETVVPGENGMLIPPRNSKALVEALGQMLENTAARRRMGKQSRLIATTKFDADKITSQYILLYRELVKRALPQRANAVYKDG